MLTPLILHVVIPPFGRLRRIPGLYATTTRAGCAPGRRQAINALVRGSPATSRMAMRELHPSCRNIPKMIASPQDVVRVENPSMRFCRNKVPMAHPQQKEH